MAERLRRTARALSERERAYVIEGWEEALDDIEDMQRLGVPDGVDLAPLDSLMAEFERRRERGDWAADRAVSDRWLAPRLHAALRLFRSEAADRGLWAWVALRFSGYVRWRWSGQKGVTEDRWRGPDHKQAFARLWWGAEIFRNGADYRPVEAAFVRQDLPNSYLNRTVVRCRSVALGILELIAPLSRAEEISSDQVNDLARTLNLAAAGTPPEAATAYQRDDADAYRSWVLAGAIASTEWDALPDGPPCRDTTEESVAGGRAFAGRAWMFAEMASGGSAAS